MDPIKILRIGLISCCLLLASGQGGLFAQEEIPRPAHLILNTVSRLIDNQRWDEAIAQLEKFQGQAPENSGRSNRDGYHHYLVNFALGNGYLNTDQPGRAVEKYRAVLKDSPRYFPGWSNLGKAYFQLQQYAQAAESFEQAYEVSHASQSQMLYLSAVAWLAGKQPEKALERIQRLRQRHPVEFTPPRQETLVQVLFALNRPRDALPAIREIIRNADGQRKKTWQEILLYQTISLKMEAAALSLAEELVREDPLEPRWWKGLAHLHLAENRHRDTLVAMTVYAQLQPLTPAEWKMVASLNLTLNIPLQSARIYENLMLTKPTPEIVRGLVHSYLKLGNTNAALKWIDTGLQHFADIDLLMLKANLQVEQNQFAAADRTYATVIAQAPDRGQAWLMRGYTAWKLGKTGIAHQALQRAVSFSEQKESALAILKQMPPK
ncbi:MAG: tetratricopeptide repeat protein [bacterium]